MNEETDTNTAADIAKDVVIEGAKTAAEMLVAFAILGAGATLVKKLRDRKAAKNTETTDES